MFRPRALQLLRGGGGSIRGDQLGSALGIDGGLARRRGGSGDRINSFVSVVDVPDIDAAIAKAKRLMALTLGLTFIALAVVLTIIGYRLFKYGS